ncbi:MAG: protein-export chaperone SecB [Bacteroidales bacterium]|nr:protein-export chaperone SecB [Bacteroidales bacterium]
MEDYSKFQFKSFKISRSLIERFDSETSKKISLEFSPKGIVNKEDGIFQLNLRVKIADQNNSFNIEIDAMANYHFENKLDIDTLNSYFFVNAPALLFPYLRAYISTLTNLSGFEPINLPTLNMTRLGEDLKKNTSEK